MCIRDRCLSKRDVAPGVTQLLPIYPNPCVAISLNGLALLYESQGQYAVAEPLYKRALAIDEEAYGPDHPGVATSLNNLARLYRDTKRDKKAEELEKRAARINSIQR